MIFKPFSAVSEDSLFGSEQLIRSTGSISNARQPILCHLCCPCPPIDSILILGLINVWRILAYD